MIDTNQLIAARIEALSVKMCEPENEGFREGIRAQEVDVEALLADTEDSSDNVLKASAMEELTASANEAAQAILDAASREAEEMRNTAVLQAQEEADRILHKLSVLSVPTHHSVANDCLVMLPFCLIF